MSQFVTRADNSIVNNIMTESYQRKPINIHIGFISEENHYIGLLDRLDLLESTLAIELYDNKYFYIICDNEYYCLEATEDMIPYKIIGYYDPKTYKINYLNKYDLDNKLNKR